MSKAVKHLKNLHIGDFVIVAPRHTTGWNQNKPELKLARFRGLLGYVDQNNRGECRSCLIEVDGEDREVDAIRVIPYASLPDAEHKSYWLVVYDFQYPPEIVAFTPHEVNFVRFGERHYEWDFAEQSRIVEERFKLQ